MNKGAEFDRMRVPRNSCDAETLPAAPVYSRFRMALIELQAGSTIDTAAVMV